MAKYLHKDIGERFSEEINSLNQQPREPVWANIDNELTKTSLKNYKVKFKRLRKTAIGLLLLLIGMLTFSVSYINTLNNNNYHRGMQHLTPSINSNKMINPVLSGLDSTIKKSIVKRKLVDNNIPSWNPANNAKQDLLIQKKLLFVKDETLSINITGYKQKAEKTPGNNAINRYEFTAHPIMLTLAERFNNAKKTSLKLRRLLM